MPLFLRPASLLLTFLLGLSPGQLFKDPEFIDARNFAIQSLGLKTSTVSFDLVYYNPNNFGLKMKGADLDVFLDDRLLGHSLVDTLVDIAARDSFDIPVKMDVEMKNLFPNALSVFTQKEFDLEVKGKARIGKNGFFVPVPIRYKGKQSLNW